VERRHHRSEPIAMMLSLLVRIGLRPGGPVGRLPSAARVPTKARSCGRRGANPGALVADHTTTSRRLRSRSSLVTSMTFLVPGEVQTREPHRQGTLADRSKNRTALQSPHPGEQHVRPLQWVGVPVGPIRITGSAGASARQRLTDSHLQPPMHDTSPRSGVGPRRRSSRGLGMQQGPRDQPGSDAKVCSR